MFQGLNNTLSVLRPTESAAADSVGGLVVSAEPVVYANVPCRVSGAAGGTRREQAMGVDLARAINVVVWPATYVIQQNDIVIPASGALAGRRFLVRDIRESSLPRTHPKSHVSLTCERVDSARTDQ
jgi:hypothetical protein